MNVNLKYFAAIREAMGYGSERMTTQVSTAGALREELIARGGIYAQELAHGKAVRMALNQELCDASAPLSEGCEVAFFPPVTGG